MEAALKKNCVPFVKYIFPSNKGENSFRLEHRFLFSKKFVVQKSEQKKSKYLSPSNDGGIC